MKKNSILLLIAVITLSFCSCTKTIEIDEEKLKQFVIEYFDDLSKGWSESDDIFVPWVTRKYLWDNAFLDHYSNYYWFIYEDNFEITSIEKIPKKEYEFFGKNSYAIRCRKHIIARIEKNTIVLVDEYGDSTVCVAPINGKLLVTGYAYASCGVKEKHLPALIKRKGLVYAE